MALITEIIKPSNF